MRYYLLILIICSLSTFLISFPVRKLGKRVLVHNIRIRDVHKEPIPRIGGLAIFFGLVIGIVCASQIKFFHKVFDNNFEIWAILISSLILAIIGLVDDIWEIDWILKLFGQVIAATITTVNGVQIVSLPIAGMVIGSNLSSQILTVIIIVAVINAINFIDGLDGLACGVTCIGATAFFYYAWELSNDTYNYAASATLCTALLIGVCVGFLPHNFHPAKTFMGDTGSQLLGFYMACASLLVTGKIDPETVNIHNMPAFMPIILPFLVLLLPVIDLMFAVVRRTIAGKSPFEPDRKHLHHRILDLGHSHLRSVLILYLWAFIFAYGGMLFIYFRGRYAIGIIALIAFVAFILTMGPKIFIKPIFDDNNKE